MEQTWIRRDLPVLAVAVEHFDDADAHRLHIAQIVDQTGLSENDVKRALRALDGAEPALIMGIRVDEFAYPVVITDVTERARRMVGQWPTPEDLVYGLTRALEAAADQEPDEQKSGRLRTAAGVLGGVAKDIVVQVASTVITGGM